MTTRHAISLGRLPIYVTQATCIVFALSPFVVLALCHALSFRASQLGDYWPSFYPPSIYKPFRDELFNRLYVAMKDEALPLVGWSALFVPSYFWALRGLCSRQFRYVTLWVHVAGLMFLAFDPSGKFMTWFLD